MIFARETRALPGRLPLTKGDSRTPIFCTWIVDGLRTPNSSTRLDGQLRDCWYERSNERWVSRIHFSDQEFTSQIMGVHDSSQGPRRRRKRRLSTDSDPRRIALSEMPPKPQFLLNMRAILGARASRPQIQDDDLLSNMSHDFCARDARAPRPSSFDKG